MSRDDVLETIAFLAAMTLLLVFLASR